MTIYIGIDHGYGFIKTLHHTFRSGVSRSWSEPTFLHHCLCLEGEFYIIGETGKAPSVDKTLDQDYYFLTLAAIAAELKTRNAGTRADIVLGTGLPFDYWQAQKKAFREYLMQRKLVKFQYAGIPYEIRIQDVQVYPQGYASIVENIQDYKEPHYIIDLGSYSMEAVCVADKIPVMTKSGSIDQNVGLIYGMDMIKRELRKSFGQSFEDEIYMKIMRDRERLLPSPYQELCEEVTQAYTEQVLGILRQMGIHTDYHKITWCGGGAKVIQTYQKFRENVGFTLNINANAKGYEFLCSHMKKEK